MKRKTYLAIFMSLFLLLVGCKKESTVKQASNQSTPASEEIKKSNIPTVFIHGYSGSNKTLKGMTHRFEKLGFSTDTMEMVVSKKGEISTSKNSNQSFQKNNPVIRLAFEDNKTHQWDQAEWIKVALSYLKTNYGVNEVNLVGFSMGGISSFLYLETYPNDDKLPKVNKLVAIGAPFNEFIEIKDQQGEDILRNGPMQVSPQLENYRDLSKNLKKETSFLLIAGQISEIDKSDGTVPLNSSLGIYSLLEEKGIEVKSETIYGVNAGHSDLRKNEEVDEYIAEFLWR
ncbi:MULTISPECIES: alpha/beta fold hydrolase [Vagococcus]|uniref:Cell surface hydrolase, membrane-bound n=1 Tax=Vagococcus fluvialis bH819 TaxID=1255619 RepID=A0A1X6WMD3_9ENTE|nr:MULTISPECIES: alpha/beta fold hydrolase [Vagococcus]SLM85427.1 Cell surface hydrolase, membrane-bound [Vagococcus fluvialis bH819]